MQSRSAFASAALAGLIAMAAPVRAGQPTVSNHLFHPGAEWRDVSGAPIDAHGGGVLYYQGIFYWYGEVKEGRTYLTEANKSWGGTRVLAGGVSCYASANLYDWTNVGIVLRTVPDQPNNDLHPEKVIERPKVIYNPRTRKFVMWMHQDNARYSLARCGVAVCDSPTGPFQYLGSFRPDAGQWPVNVAPQDKTAGENNPLARDFKAGQMARDQTLFVDDDRTAYLFYASEENATMHVSRLTSDYLRPSGQYARILEGRSIEAPAVFKRGGKYFLIGSGCTGWAPNTAHCAVADQIFGPWTELGNPCHGDNAEKTFNCQSAFVLKVPGQKDAFIALFDRWQQWDLANSRYVWLPMRFRGDRPIIEWQPAWSLAAKTGERAEAPPSLEGATLLSQ